MEAIQHSHLPWRFGPLYYVFASPMFHSVHHSVSAEHHDRNFGGILSIWDFLFGTAVTAAQRPGDRDADARQLSCRAFSRVA